MKKQYMKPSIELEVYELDASIAGNCQVVVKVGPEMGDHAMCEGYEDPFGRATFSLRSRPYNVNFYADTGCDCYTTGSDYGQWTS